MNKRSAGPVRGASPGGRPIAAPAIRCCILPPHVSIILQSGSADPFPHAPGLKAALQSYLLRVISMDMDKWIDGLIKAEKRRALPLLSFPAVQLMGISVRDLISDSGIQARAMYEVASRCRTPAAVTMMDLSVEAECFGAEIRFSDNEVPNVIGAVLEEAEDAESLRVPEMGSGRTGLYVEAVAKALELIKDRPVLAGVIGPFSLAGRLLGMTEIMYACYDEPAAVHDILRKSTEFITKYAAAFKAAGASGVVIAEPAAGLLSPAMCGEFSSPYVKAVTDAVQDGSFITVYHNCGNSVGAMVPEIVSTGCAAYHFGNAADMRGMLEKMPSGVPVMGNIDPVADFRMGTPEKIRADTLALLEECSSYPNFIISSGCDIPPAAPWENIDAFFGAVEEYNRSESR